MKLHLTTFMICAGLSTSAMAAIPDVPKAKHYEQAVANADKLALAWQVVGTRHAGLEQDVLTQIRAQAIAPLTAFERAPQQKLDKKFEQMRAKFTPVIRRNVMIVMEAYAQAYARDYSRAELRQLAAQSGTDVSIESDAGVTSARARLYQNVAPLFAGLTGATCKQTADMRTTGQKDAKCDRA